MATLTNLNAGLTYAEGDSLTATKLNTMQTAAQTLVNDIDGGTQLATTDSNVFKQKNGANLEFRELIGGTNITLTENDTNITIDAPATAPLGWELISTATASASASLDFTSGIDSTYTNYAVVISGIRMTTDNTQFYMRAGEGTPLVGAAYQYHSNTSDASSLLYSSAIGSTSSSFQLATSVDFASTDGISGVLYFSREEGVSKRFYTHGTMTWRNNTNNKATGGSFRGLNETSMEVSQLTFLASDAANLLQGTISLYGIAS